MGVLLETNACIWIRPNPFLDGHKDLALKPYSILILFYRHMARMSFVVDNRDTLLIFRVSSHLFTANLSESYCQMLTITTTIPGTERITDPFLWSLRIRAVRLP